MAGLRQQRTLDELLPASGSAPDTLCAFQKSFSYISFLNIHRSGDETSSNEEAAAAASACSGLSQPELRINYGGAQPRFVSVSKASAGATEGKKALTEEQMYHQEYEV